MWKTASVLAICLHASSLQACKFPFEPSFSAASAKATSRGWPVLVIFTGSDWSLRSVTLDKDLLEHQAIEKLIETSFIPVLADFPQRTKLATAVQKANADMAEKYAVTHFPTLIATRADGSEIGRLEFNRETVDSLMKTLQDWASQTKPSGQAK